MDDETKIDPKTRTMADLDPETQKVALKAMQLRSQNVQIVTRLAQMGADVDIAAARLEQFMLWLVEAGIITEHQLWEESLSWEKALRSQLQDVLETVKSQAVRNSIIVPGRN